jgi:membrane protease YdiL (CAAX protease family)
MSTRTPFLSALIVLSSAFPAQVIRIGPAPRRWLIPLLFAVMGALAWYVAPTTGVLARPASPYWYAVAAVLGVALPGLEIGVGVSVARLRRVRVARIAVHERGSLGLVVVVVTAVGEEIVFRGVGLHLLERSLGWYPVAAVAVTAVLYGLNHLYFGWLTVLQKCVSGALFGVLYNVSGHSLVIPLTAHLVQNLVVVLVLSPLGTPPPHPGQRR